MKTETQTEHVGSYRTPDGKAQIDWTIRNIGDKPEFSASGNYNGSAGQCLAEIFSAYGNDATVRRLYRLWQAHHLKELPPGALKSLLEIKSNAHESFHEHQAQAFLDRFSIKFRATLSDSKVAPWSGDSTIFSKETEQSRHHYRVTLSKAHRVGGINHKAHRLTFDFWASIADAEKQSGLEEKLQAWRDRGAQMEDEPPHVKEDWRTEVASLHKALAALHPTPYDVLACISSDAYCPDTFKEWASEFGESEDSIKALQTYRRCAAFAKRLQAFFTQEEIEALAEIQ